MSKKDKPVQRAIIFQGGVALGAYEAGVFKALVKKLGEQDSKNDINNQSKPLFDIVAGTSIGAMNAAIVVSDIRNKKTWQDSADDLYKFWKMQKYQWPTVADFLDMNPLYRTWWDFMHNTSRTIKESISKVIESNYDTNPLFNGWNNMFTNFLSLVDKDFLKDYFLDGWYIPATAEAARRYYSAKQFHTFGAPNVATGLLPWYSFGKFFDFTEQSNYLPRPDNKHILINSLKETLEQFVKTPIAADATKSNPSNKETGQREPRFLLVAVDVKTGDAVTFDSYEKRENAQDTKGNILKDSEGNNLTKYYSEYGDEQNKNIIFYDKGIDINHILASGTFPGFFDYPKFEVVNISDKDLQLEYHIFWDGGFRSNTPLRELIQAHRDYYHDKNETHKDKEAVPDLEIYIADLWPSKLKEEPLSFDLDFVDNRKFGIQFGDKTDYDEQVANFVTDYIDLAKELRNLARKKGISEEEIKVILDKEGISKNRKGERRTYKELLEGRFKVTKVVRIDHKDDGNEVGNKIFDYSQATIEKLMTDGYNDTIIKMEIESIKDEFFNLKDKISRLEGKKKKDTVLNDIQKDIQQIQNIIKIENIYDGTTTKIMNPIDDLINKVKSNFNLVDHETLKENKELVIAAAKQFQETIKRINNERLQSKLPLSQ